MGRMDATRHQGASFLALDPAFCNVPPAAIAWSLGLLSDLTIERGDILAGREHSLLASDPVAILPELRSGWPDLKVLPLGIHQLVGLAIRLLGFSGSGVGQHQRSGPCQNCTPETL